MDYSEYVHEYVDDTGVTRYVVAKCVDGWYIAPMSASGRMLTGAGWLAGRRVADVAGGMTYTFACRRDAIICARVMYGNDED